jgi:hypothetical protein
MKTKTHMRQRKRITSALVSMLIALALIPALPQTSARADATYTGVQNSLTLYSGTYTLNNVSITAKNRDSGIDVYGNVILNIRGTNTIKGGVDKSEPLAGGAGIRVDENASLIIQGNGVLYAYGGNATDAWSYETNNTDYASNYGKMGGAGGAAGIGTIGGNGSGSGENGGNGKNCGSITIRETVTVYAQGGDGSSGGDGSPGVSKQSGGGGGGGGGYPAAGIGGGGAGGGGGGYGQSIDASHSYGVGGGGGGGFSGGGGGGWSGRSGTGSVRLGFVGGTDGNGSVSDNGGGGYHSASRPILSTDIILEGSGKIGGGGGYSSLDYKGGDGGIGGKSGSIIIASTAKVTAVNGSNNLTFNRGAKQPVKGIGSGAGYIETASGSYSVASVPSTPGAPKVSPGNGQVTISWAAPAANGAAITNYEVFQDGVSIGTTTSLSMKKTGLKNQIKKQINFFSVFIVK